MNIQNINKKAINYNKGLTTVPSDFLSTDEELTESAGMIMKNGEMVPIQRPKLLFDMACGKLEAVHKGADYENFVFFDKEQSMLHFYRRNDDSLAFIQSIEIKSFISMAIVNNTLIVATNEGMLYILLDGDSYKVLGYGLPNYNFTPIHNDPIYNTNKTNYKTEFNKSALGTYTNYVNFTYDGKPTDIQGDHSNLKKIACTNYTLSDEEEFNNAITGAFTGAINKAKEFNGFSFPFFIRAALRLYDGSYAKISTPILCCPCIDRNFDCSFYLDGDKYVVTFLLRSWDALYVHVQIDDIESWQDIIKEIVFFVSEDTLPCIPDDGWTFKLHEVWGTKSYNCIGGEGDTSYEWGITNSSGNYFLVPKNFKSEDDFIDELSKKSVFYKISEVPLTDIIEATKEKYATDSKILGDNYFGDDPIDECEFNSDEYHKHRGDIKLRIRDHVIETLTSQEQLPNDDYYEWTRKMPSNMYVYNKRLNIYSYLRQPYNGNRYLAAFKRRLKTYYTDELFKPNYTCYVHIKYGFYDEWVKVPAFLTLNVLWMAGSWFYYPDPNAVEVRFINEGGKGFAFNLRAHSRLNGAYCFQRMPAEYDSKNTKEEYVLSDIERPVVGGSYEHFDSQILTSVVNNPFVFQANGDNTVGTGSIVGIAANTEPISQGQFGQYPLLVFTTEGIYGLSVDSEGLYAASHPMSREVCNNPNSITPTDRLVFFTSEKGLMAISGGAATCVSTQLSGPNPRDFKTIGDGDFRHFLKDCRIAYDYRESILRIYSPSVNYHYVYNVIDQTFAKMWNEEAPMLTIASDYPDSLVQEADGKIYSMLAKPDINADTRSYSGTFVTRPLKLGSSLELKTIRQMLHFFNSDTGKLSLRIFASNDCRTWAELHSLQGKPWKFYTLQYDLANLRAIDSYAGTVLAIETRLNDKMR